MSAERWERLASTLQRAYIPAEVSTRHGGQPVTTTHTITLRYGTWAVEINDTWWSKNPDTWTGWQVFLVGGDSIDRYDSAKTKNRNTVLQYVRDAIAEIPPEDIPAPPPKPVGRYVDCPTDPAAKIGEDNRAACNLCGQPVGVIETPTADLLSFAPFGVIHTGDPADADARRFCEDCLTWMETAMPALTEVLAS